MTTQRQDGPSPSPLSPVISPSDQPAFLTSHEREAIALQQELAALRAAHEQELAALREEMAAQIVMLRNALAATQPQPVVALIPQESLSPAPVSPDDDAVEEPDEPSHAHANGATSRRTLLKWGGVGAAAALAVAGGAALTTPTAHAADSANLVLGHSDNTAEHATVLTYDGSEATPTALQVSIANDDSTGVYGAAGNATSGNSAYGVLGTAGTGAFAIGVSGSAGTDAVGVSGAATGASSVGVYGATDAGFGVVGLSLTGIDIVAIGTGRLLQNLSGFVGAPTSGSYLIGEQIRDNNGDLYICVVSGAPGTWHKVLTVDTGNTGIISLLSAPIRLLDTRLNHTTWTSGSVHTLQVTGVLVGSIQVPNGAIGVVGNVTVVQPTGAGDLRLYPGGAPLPGTSSINFASGQIIANGVIVGLDSNGQMNIKVDMPANTATNVLFDASGYIM
ncbi:MAG TPA: hypothetical protein VFX24_12800 [Ktedonobacterales bacterium]|nr:hypothetical protein [Ktedonobacterales bacterium]